jgi:hypothetical protein
MLYGPNHPKILDAARLMVDAFNQVHSVCRTEETPHGCQLSLQDRGNMTSRPDSSLCAVTMENTHVIRIEIEYVVRIVMEMDEGTEGGISKN